MSTNTLKKKETGEQAWLWGLNALLNADGVAVRVPDTLMCGWISKKPISLGCGEEGKLHVLVNVPVDSVTAFLQSTREGFPLCVLRHYCTSLLMDPLSVTSAWHKSLASGRAIFIQRYIQKQYASSSIIRVQWTPESTQYIRIANKVPFHTRRRSTMLLLMKASHSLEDRFLTRPEHSVLSTETPDLDLQESVKALIGALKRSVPEKFELSEAVAEYTENLDSQWYFLRVVSYELSKGVRKPKLFRPATRQKRSISAPKKGKMSIKRLSQAILSIKTVMGLEITSGDRKRVSEHADYSRLASRTSLPLAKRKKSTKQEFAPKETDYQALNMPPIFQFPTPKDQEDSLSRSCTNLKDIHEHIRRQNNSLFMRIHFQEELPQEKLMKDYVRKSVNNIASEFDRLRSLGVEGRRQLTQYKELTD